VTQEFHISVTPIGEDDYLVRTERVAPGVPLAEEQVTWPVDEWLAQASLLMNDPIQGLLRGDMLHSLADGFSSSGQLPETQGTLVALGQQLYNALFQGTIRDSWMTAQGIAQHRQEVLRLRLGLKDVRLPRLPWEVLHAGNRPIATGTDVVFSRYHSSFAAMASPLQFQATADDANQPLKILMVLAAPTDQEMLALKEEALHLQTELQTALSNGSKNGSKSGRYSDIQLTLLEQPGREQLTQALEHNHYHVLHYAGHSNLGTAGGKLYLVSSRTGLTETLSGDDLAGLLVNNGIRMAVFNSCRGVYTATAEVNLDSGDGNLAEALVRRGIPAVLAMAERIPDDVALNLSRLFYRNLKQVYPVDLSLNRARQGLISSYSSNQLYWALPILYLHPEFDGNLLSLDGLGESGSTSPIDRAVEIEPVLAVETVPPGTEHVFTAVPAAGQSAIDSRLPLVATRQGVDASTLDPDDLEFDDPQHQSDMETVARLVNELSNGNTAATADEDHLLPASPNENLLPDAAYEFNADDYLILPDYPQELLAAEPVGDAKVNADGVEISSPTAVNASDADVYSELARLLADTGKLTEAIAACQQAVRDNPNDANAYYQLGLALNQQGYVAEAIAAYHQALHINPTLADVHNQLGLALYQQGNFSEAAQAYEHAIQLDSKLTSARRNLAAVLERQGSSGDAIPSGSGGALSYRQDRGATTLDRLERNSRQRQQLTGFAAAPSAAIAPRRQTPLHRQPFLWVGAGLLTALLFGLWVWRDQWLSSTTPIALPDASFNKVTDTTDLQRVSTNVVAALATDQLNQGNIAAAQSTVETLLDRNALTQAAAVLTPVLKQQADNSTINFLVGRLAWQSIMAGNKDYSVDDARRYWETSVKQKPTAQSQNALGFAYYTEGKLDRASQAWLQALKLAGAQTAAPARASQTGAPTSPTALTSYAGLALVVAKSAANQPPSKQASLQNEAIQLRQKVLTDDPVNFQPEALTKNWMWSEAAIRDWRSILALK